MKAQSPEVVAAADLSPLSPSPLHTSSPRTVFNLQDHAKTLDVASLDSPAAAKYATMAFNPEPAEMSDTIVVGGDYSDDSQGLSVADDDSFDAYSEGDDGQAQKNQPDVGNDDYARTFDSPPQAQNEDEPDDEHEHEAEPATQPDVPKASESMNSSSAPDTLKSQSPAAAAAPASAPAPISHSSPSPDSSRPGSPVQQHLGSTENSTEPSAEPGAAAAEAPPPEPAADNSLKSPAITSAGEEPASASAGDDKSTVDIQKLVDDITARATTASAANPPTSQSPPTVSQPLPAPLNVSQPTSLPPRPSSPARQSDQLISRPEDFHPFQSQTVNSHAPLAPGLPGPPAAAAQAIPHTTYMAAAPPGTTNDAISSLPPPPSTSFNGSQPFASLAHVQPTAPAGGNVPGDGHRLQAQQAWEAFQADEKRYMTEAKWERFPDGSRIFIGNLSSERVSKSEVFELFHKFGRLAQISLKSAYGFVQYHHVADAQAAMQHAQGAELGGRKIHLEYSRMQKKKEEKERSPDRRNQRGDRGGRGADRYDGREKGRRGRDDYRPGRSASPRRDDTYGRDRNHFPSVDRSSRGRSRSPPRHGRHNSDQYRRRSPSPRRHGPSEGDRLDIPRRYGDEVPDVQLLLLQEVERDFVSWVQKGFLDRGLRSDVMFLNPRFPRDAVLQRQVLEGVHGVIELDLRAQTLGKIPLQVFDRSSGINNVRFDQYQDLDPKIAAELVYRTKTQAAPQPPHPAAPAYPPNQYGQPPYPYQGQAAGYPYQTPHAPAPAPHHQPAASAQDIASVVGQLDNTALQALLASLQGGQSTAAAPSTIQPPGANHAAVAQNAQIDINALLGRLGAAPAAPSGPAGMANYGAHLAYALAGGSHPLPPGAGGPAPGLASGEADTAQQVQNIMATLSRYRQ